MGSIEEKKQWSQLCRRRISTILYLHLVRGVENGHVIVQLPTMIQVSLH